MSRVWISEQLRQEVFERDHFTCRYCGNTDGPFHADHVYPVSKGGETTAANLVTACRRCNIRKSNKIGIWPNSIQRQKSKKEERSFLGLIVLVIGIGIASISILAANVNYGLEPKTFLYIGLLVALFGVGLEFKKL